MIDIAKRKRSPGCGLSFSVLLLAGITWLCFKGADALSSPSVSTRLPEEHQALTSALQAGMIIASVLLPLLLWALNRKADAGSVLKGIVLFWLLAGILTLATTCL